MASSGPPSHVLFLLRVSWVWLNLLSFDVSNQGAQPDEDRINKPWRPIPSGRISQEDARILRGVLLVACLVLSSKLGVFPAGLVLSIATFCHNELRFDNHWLTRALCNAIGYTCFNAGASGVLSGTPERC